MFSVSDRGSFKNFESFAKRVQGSKKYRILDSLAQSGVDALIAHTPSESGLTAASWSYELVFTGSGCQIIWKNSNVQDGFSVAIGLQYGHGTGTGGWIPGMDYINPAIRPVFDKIADGVWKVVTGS